MAFAKGPNLRERGVFQFDVSATVIHANCPAVVTVDVTSIKSPAVMVW
jgi:hypothetical protein